MTTWTELRTVALVGTERRALPGADSVFLADLPDGQSPEQRALHIAALLGVARRAGAPIAQAPAPDPSAPEPGTPERLAPAAAVQLLELMLTGNAGPGIMSDELIVQWFDRCRELSYVLPHRLLVATLNYATTSHGVRTAMMTSLGSRGHWLAAQREPWSWAIPLAHTSEEASVEAVDLDALLQLPADQRDARLTAARSADSSTGRQLIADACTRLDAASRARVLGLLDHQLGPDDEDILETALDDRSKLVRTTAIAMLDGLTTSARAARLARWLDPLVTKSGTMRKTIKITFPAPPEDEQLRDLVPASKGVIEQQWLDTLITGTPLSWWEEKLAMSPAKIVGSKLSHSDELLHAWSEAAIAQKNQSWLGPLFEKTKRAALMVFISSDVAAAAFVASLTDKTTDQIRASLLSGVAQPWDKNFSQHVITWARKTNGGKGAITRMNMAQTMMAQWLAPEIQPQLQSWLDTVRGDEDKALQRVLRNLIQQLSFKTSIDKAFA